MRSSDGGGELAPIVSLFDYLTLSQPSSQLRANNYSMSFKDVLEAGAGLSLVNYLDLKSLLQCAPANRTLFSLSVHKLVVHKAGVDRARPLEQSGRKLCEILEAARYFVHCLGLAHFPPHISKALDKAGNVSVLRQPHLMSALLRLNADMYTFWNGTPADPHKGIFEELDLALKMDTVDRARSKELRPLLQKNCKYWGTSRVQDNFIFLFDRPDGSVLVSEDMTRVYLVLGQAQSMGDVANLGFRDGDFFQKPKYPSPSLHGPVIGVVLKTTLLNWEGKIVYDGLLAPSSVAAGSLLRKALEAYLMAYNSNKLISSLELKEPVTVSSNVLNEMSPEELTILVHTCRRDVDAIMTRPVTPRLGAQPSIWVFRRFGYSEKENPHHMVAIMAGGMFVGQMTTRLLDPSPQEYVECLLTTVNQHKMRPQHIAVDCQAAVTPLRKIFAHTEFSIGYYPPPSPEEEELNNASNPSLHSPPIRCAMCGVSHCANGKPLLQCSECKRTFYCCKDHQREDWKRHKRACKLVR